MGIKNKNLIDTIRRNDNYFEDFITRSVYHSNAIEGNTLSYYETYQIIFNCSSKENMSNVKPRDIYEAINLKYAMDYIFRHLDEDITPGYIIKLGQIINKNINEIDSFRTSPVFIRGAQHIPPNASDVPRLINELLYTSFQTDDFLRELAEFHIRYERIHPFGDGNGRTGRMIMFKQCLQNNCIPFVLLDRDRAFYLRGLKEWDFERNYLMDTLLTQQDIYASVCEQLDFLKE